MLFNTGYSFRKWEVSLEWDSRLPVSLDIWRSEGSLNLRFLKFEIIGSRRSPPVFRN